MIRLLCAAFLACAALTSVARADNLGAYVVLEIEEAALRRQRLVELSWTMTNALREATPAIAIAGEGAGSDSDAARVALQTPSQSAAARTVIEAALQARGMADWVALHVRDDGTIEARFTESGWQDILAQTRLQSAEIIRRRLDPASERALALHVRDDGDIVAHDPAAGDPQQLRTRIGVTGALTFHLVRDDLNPIAGPLPRDVMVAAQYIDQERRSAEIVDRAPLMTGERLVSAHPAEDEHTGEIVLSFQLDSSGTRTFCQITREHIGQRFAILLDGRVLTAPLINEPICGGTGQISGAFDTRTATNLAVLLRAGALPAPLRVVAQGVGAPP